MSEKMGPIISTNGLVFCVDAANPQSIVSGQTIWKDLTFNTTGGTLTNGVIFTGTGVSSGLSYDGTDDYISNINGVSTTNQISVNAWIRPRSVNNFQHIVDASNNTWHLAILNTNNVYFWDGFNYQRSGATVNANFNYMVTGVRNTTTNRIYLNGSLTESIAGTNNISTNTINISRWQGINTGATPSRYFTGTTYGVQIYDRGITPFEVFQNFNAMKGRYGIPDIVTGGLVLNLDAGNPYSYNPDNTGSTVWTDVSYTSSGGTLINGASYTGGTIQFDGTNDYVICNTPDVFNLVNDLTLSCWAKPMGNSGVYRVIVGKYYTNNNPTYEMGISNGNKFYWYGNGVDKYGTTNIQLNTFYNFVITINSSAKTGVLYINGSVEASISGLATQVANNGPLYVGVDAPTGVSEGAFFNGNVGNVQIYNRALSATEVQQNFNALRGRYGI
jgi:hypothetical protein